MQLFYISHGSSRIQEATPEIKEIVENYERNHFEETDVSEYIDYWTQYHLDDINVVEFLTTHNIVHSGTNDTLGIDLFWVGA
jgi:hypothetical protein